MPPPVFNVSGSLLFPRNEVSAVKPPLGPAPGPHRPPGKVVLKGGKGKSRRNKKGRKAGKTRHR